MQTRLIRIGNSQGIRLPKSVIRQAGLGGEYLDLEVTNNAVVIRAAPAPREGWAAEAAACRTALADQLDEWDAALADFDGEWQ